MSIPRMAANPVKWYNVGPEDVHQEQKIWNVFYPRFGSWNLENPNAIAAGPQD
jgi:hypothetical protein